MKLKWKSWAAANPGFSVWAAIPSRDENVLYVIRRKKETDDFKPTGWRVFARANKGEALRTIYTDPNLNECKRFVQDWEDKIASSD